MHAVTASEAGEQKRLLVLDAETGWTVSETIPLDMGPRHHRLASRSALEALYSSASSSPSSTSSGYGTSTVKPDGGALTQGLGDVSTDAADATSPAAAAVAASGAGAGASAGSPPGGNALLRSGDRVKLSVSEEEAGSMELLQRQLALQGEIARGREPGMWEGSRQGKSGYGYRCSGSFTEG